MAAHCKLALCPVAVSVRTKPFRQTLGSGAMSSSESEEVLQPARGSSESDEVLQAAPQAKRQRSSRHKDKGGPCLIAVLGDSRQGLPDAHRDHILRVAADHQLGDVAADGSMFLLGVAVVHWSIRDPREPMPQGDAMVEFVAPGTRRGRRGHTLAHVHYVLGAAHRFLDPVRAPEGEPRNLMSWLRGQCRACPEVAAFMRRHGLPLLDKLIVPNALGQLVVHTCVASATWLAWGRRNLKTSLPLQQYRPSHACVKHHSKAWQSEVVGGPSASDVLMYVPPRQSKVAQAADPVHVDRFVRAANF